MTRYQSDNLLTEFRQFADTLKRPRAIALKHHASLTGSGIVHTPATNRCSAAFAGRAVLRTRLAA
jgi:hypothetical protein